jgi:hypothetical protein
MRSLPGFRKRTAGFVRDCAKSMMDIIAPDAAADARNRSDLPCERQASGRQQIRILDKQPRYFSAERGGKVTGDV